MGYESPIEKGNKNPNKKREIKVQIQLWQVNERKKKNPKTM